MTDKTEKVNIDSSDKTVIGLKGSEQHHDLKNQPGKDGDPNHVKASDKLTEDKKAGD